MTRHKSQIYLHPLAVAHLSSTTLSGHGCVALWKMFRTRYHEICNNKTHPLTRSFCPPPLSLSRCMQGNATGGLLVVSSFVSIKSAAEESNVCLSAGYAHHWTVIVTERWFIRTSEIVFLAVLPAAYRIAKSRKSILERKCANCPNEIVVAGNKGASVAKQR